MSGTSTTESEPDGSTEAVDRFYRALADHRRRIAIRVVHRRGAVELEALADAIATQEPGESDRETIQISLVHQHLPLLNEAGIVEYDSEAKRVTARDAVDDVLPLAGLPLQ